jgi:hypothetical protein
MGPITRRQLEAFLCFAPLRRPALTSSNLDPLEPFASVSSPSNHNIFRVLDQVACADPQRGRVQNTGQIARPNAIYRGSVRKPSNFGV